MQQFKVATRRSEPVRFRVDGDDHEYVFVAPKQATLLLSAVAFDPTDAAGALPMVKGMFDWLDAGLGVEQAARIEARLRNPDDDLDVDTLTEIIKWLTEQTSGRPTTPPSD